MKGKVMLSCNGNDNGTCSFVLLVANCTYGNISI